MWEITIHFQHFPADKILKCDSLDKIRDYYSHSLKQALHLMYGSINIFTLMSLENKSNMWSSVTTGDYTKYIDSASSILSSEEAIRLLPIRLIQADKPTIQKPISASPSAKLDATSNAADDSSNDLKPTNNTTTLQDTLTILYPLYNENEYNLTIQGIEVSLSVPIYELWQLLRHPDLFLYIIMTPK